MELIRRYAWTMALSGSVLLGGAGIGYVLAGRLDGAPTWLALAGGVLLLLYPVLDRDTIVKTASQRNVQRGSGATLLTALFAALSVGLYMLAVRYDTTWDLTSKGSFSVADQSIAVVAGLDAPVEVLAFYQGANPDGQAIQRTLELLQEHTDQLSVQYIDPVRQPRLADVHEIRGRHGTVLIRRGDVERRLELPTTEERLVEGLVTVISGETHQVCWATGHGEADPDDGYTERGLGAVVVELESLNYQVMRQRVPSDGIGRDCDALVIARPREEWLPFELEALAAYLAEGGRVVVLLEPGLTPGLADELARYGVVVGQDLVIDVNPANQLMGIDDPAFIVVAEEGVLSHPITDNLASALIFPLARTVAPNRERSGVRVRSLLLGSEASWAETNPEGAEVGPDEHELQGQVPLATVTEIVEPEKLEVAASTQAPEQEPLPIDDPDVAPTVDGQVPAPIDLEGDVGRAVPHDFAPAPGGRLVVFGDSDFASNVFLALGNNRDLFMNTVAWLVDESDQLGERPDAQEVLEITEAGEALLCIISVFLVPGGALLLAIATWLRRRSL